MKCLSCFFGGGFRNSCMFVLGMAEWTELPLLWFVMMLLVVLKYHCPCYMLSLCSHFCFLLVGVL